MVNQIVSVDPTGPIIGDECGGVLLPHMTQFESIWEAFLKTSFALL